MSFFLKTRGAAGVRQDDGELSPEPGGAGVDRIVHDPWQPVPALGGHAAPQTGVHDRAFIDARFDVLTYTTAPLERQLTIAGDIVLELHVESDATDFDVDAVLSVLADDGRVLNIVHAHGRVGDRAAGPFELPMRGTLMTLPAGRRLRLSLAGAAFPAFPVNPGTGASPTDAAASECLPIVIAVRSGGKTPSRLRIAALVGDV
jgi:putative CocE/NonD family hydrolase